MFLSIGAYTLFANSRVCPAYLPAEKKNRNHYRIPNGFNGYKRKCIGFNGNFDGPSKSLLVICFLLLVVHVLYWIPLRTNRTPLKIIGYMLVSTGHHYEPLGLQ